MKPKFVRTLVNGHIAVILAALTAGSALAQGVVQLTPAAKDLCYESGRRPASQPLAAPSRRQAGRVKIDLFHSQTLFEQSTCGYYAIGRPRVTSVFAGPEESLSNSETGETGTKGQKPGPFAFVQSQGGPQGADEAQELAKKLSNPVASLISLPLQSNFDFGMGSGSGWRYTLNVQPVIPIKLNEEWNLISRTIVPIIHQGNVTGPNTSQTGLGDIVQSFFFSPNKTEPLIWAVGPVVLIPTATNDALGSEKLGLGPTALALKQKKGWTYGVLANHIWSVAGKSSRADVNATFIQPFLSYSNKQAWTYSINTESTYDWVSNSWSIPINPFISKLVRFGKQPVSFGGGLRCWATTPTGGPEGCGLRIVVTALFPKG